MKRKHKRALKKHAKDVIVTSTKSAASNLMTAGILIVFGWIWEKSKKS
jgi:hypothetical protein